MAADTRAVKIFISYSRTERLCFEIFKSGLERALINLSDFTWEIWEDTRLNPGEVWDEEIQQKVSSCDIALLLVSTGYMTNDYIRIKEFEQLLKRYDNREALVIPVAFAPANFTNWPDLSRLQFFKPEGAVYGQDRVSNFTFTYLIQIASDKTAISSPYAGQYYIDLAQKIADSYKEFITRITPSVKAAIVEPTAEVKKARQAEIPVPRPYFTGRDAEQEDFKRAIDNKVKLIAIDGPGGIGKTQFVGKCIERFIPRDKIIWYNCAKAPQFDALISSAGYPDLLLGSNKTDREKYSAFKDKIQENEFFLFLDNFQETHKNPAFKEFLLFLNEYLTDGCVVVLDRDIIRNFELPVKSISIRGLDVKQSLIHARKLINYAYSELDITDEKLDGLCAQLQGYPLAIDLAVYLLSEKESPENILTKIANEESGSKISERLLNAIFERPDATEEEREFMRQFSVFTGQVDEAAVKAVMPEKVFAANRALKRKNLLATTEGLFSVHPLVREFCYKELKEAAPVHARAAEYYIAQRQTELDPILEEQIFYHLDKSGQHQLIETEIENKGREYIRKGQLTLVSEWIEKLKQLHIEKPVFDIFLGDIAEVQGKWDLAMQHFEKAMRQDVNVAVKVQGMLDYGVMLHARGGGKQAMPYFEHALQLATDNNDLKREKAKGLNHIGAIYRSWGELDNALNCQNKALEIAREINDEEIIAGCLISVTDILQSKGETAERIKICNECLQLEIKMGNKRGQALVLRKLGGIDIFFGNIRSALNYFEESLIICRQIGDKSGIGACWTNFADIAYIESDFEKSLALKQSSLEISEEIGDKASIANSLLKIGSLYNIKGEIVQARKNYIDALAINEELQNNFGIASSYVCLGEIEQHKGKYKMAIDYFKKALAIYDNLNNRYGRATVLVYMGNIYSVSEKYKEALDCFDQAWEIHDKMGGKGGKASVLKYKGDVFARKRENDAALLNYSSVLKLYEEIGDKSGYATAIGDIGSVYGEMGELDKAIEYQLRAVEIVREIGRPSAVATGLGNIGLTYDKMKQYPKAIDAFEQSLEIKRNLDDKDGIAITLYNAGVLYYRRVKKYEKAAHYLMEALALFNMMEVKIKVQGLIAWLNDFAEKLGALKFNALLTEAYNNLAPELKQYVNLKQYLAKIKDEHLPDLGRNESCFCGSGVKFKNCHGKGK